jgi:hypothetical protein
MKLRVAHASWSAQTNATRRSGLPDNPQFNTYKPRKTVQKTEASSLPEFGAGADFRSQMSVYPQIMRDPESGEEGRARWSEQPGCGSRRCSSSNFSCPGTCEDKRPGEQSEPRRRFGNGYSGEGISTYHQLILPRDHAVQRGA